MPDRGYVIFFITFTFEILLRLHKSGQTQEVNKARKTQLEGAGFCALNQTPGRPWVRSELSRAAVLHFLTRGSLNTFVLPKLPAFTSRLLCPATQTMLLDSLTTNDWTTLPFVCLVFRVLYMLSQGDLRLVPSFPLFSEGWGCCGPGKISNSQKEVM